MGHRCGRWLVRTVPSRVHDGFDHRPVSESASPSERSFGTVDPNSGGRVTNHSGAEYDRRAVVWRLRAFVRTAKRLPDVPLIALSAFAGAIIGSVAVYETPQLGLRVLLGVATVAQLLVASWAA